MAGTCRRTGSETSGPKRDASHRLPDQFVTGVGLPVGDVVRRGLDQMADVVQQRREIKRVGRIGALREMSRLQAMLGHGHRLAEIGGGAAAAIERQELRRSSLRLLCIEPARRPGRS